MKALRVVGSILGLLVLLIGVVALGARFADGPVAIFPGGPLASGEWIEDPKVDWSFAADIGEIELESAGRSRTTWILVEGGDAYIPCSLSFPPGKSWHKEALTKPEAAVRVEGKRYRRNLVKVEDGELHRRLFGSVQSKYGDGPLGDASDVWFFHLAPPAS